MGWVSLETVNFRERTQDWVDGVTFSLVAI